MSNKTTWTDPVSMEYHIKQWTTPKESTKSFEKFIKYRLIENITVVDIGCGAGAPTAYLAQNHPKVNFIGIEYSEELVEAATNLAKKINNLVFKHGDIFNLPSMLGIDGVLLLQTISWIDGFEKPLQEIIEKINPNWMAMTGLFYEGDISCRTEVIEFKKESRKVFYNTYSIPAVKRHCEKYNYKIAEYFPFEISIDIDKSNNIDVMSTYTERIYAGNESTKRIQISGPLLLNWYTIILEKENALL